MAIPVIYAVVFMLLASPGSELSILSNLANTLCSPEMEKALAVGAKVGEHVYDMGELIRKSAFNIEYYLGSNAFTKPIGSIIDYKGMTIMYIGHGIWFPTTAARMLIQNLCVDDIEG